jgi:putative transposase
MTKNNVVNFAGRDAMSDPLTELLRLGAEQLIYQAVKEELQELLVAHSQRRQPDGKAGVVRNGYLPRREL